MCGRFALTLSSEELPLLMGYDDGVDFPPRFNIAPTQPIATVRLERHIRRFALIRWGLVPAWVKDPAGFPLLFNARSEGAADKASFRAAMRYRRCLVPASGFYEWKREGTRKQPFWIRPRGGGVIALGGLWETWSGPDGNEIDTGCILTTSANETVAPIHDRMPVIIVPTDFDRWLNADGHAPAEIMDLMQPASPDLLEAIPVGPDINSARNEGPEVQASIPAGLF